MTNLMHPFLKDLPYYKILENPTPLEVLGTNIPIPSKYKQTYSLSDHANILIKRDDLTPGFGNKTRKLEFLLQNALDINSDCVVTAGGPQSNHCRQTAQFARKLGIETHLMFGTKTGDRDFDLIGNPFIDSLFSAQIHTCKKPERAQQMEILKTNLVKQGKRPYIIPVGGSNYLGVIAYAKAFFEVLKQSNDSGLNFNKIVFATSSGGTHSGLILGKKLSNWEGEIIGISIDQIPDEDETDQSQKYVKFMTGIANDAIKYLNLNFTITESDFQVNYSYLQGGYGVLGEIDKLGVHTLGNLGILSGPVYSGRAFGALIDMLSKGEFNSKDNILFWHTGGVGELEVYREGLLT